MLTDYNIKRKGNRREIFLAVLPFIQFMLLLTALQCALILLSGTAGEEAREAVRVRVIADSNTAAAQQVKAGVAAEVSRVLGQAALKDPSGIEGLIPELQLAAEAVSGGAPVRIMYGAAFFPPKPVDGGFIPQARTDSLVVTVGSGRGDNWWCALFSDVCEPGEVAAEEEETEEEPVTFFIVEWLKSLFG
ncbi:stage II sporulation protein R [Bhargavaea cecembensis DSE10]|uniref:Stage II sporulation protein R n=1 Tax=Bhargavaea cecembensis DSE10 TaxID=1235279 RepID=M7PBM6_9BACL|nr:stage II sporulation protein R [Bhargavaea cecembensis]EMR07879.1 stage II sporulation protein R [Bhargavaea cecembensis DSE10]